MDGTKLILEPTISSKLKDKKELTQQRNSNSNFESKKITEISEVDTIPSPRKNKAYQIS